MPRDRAQEPVEALSTGEAATTGAVSDTTASSPQEVVPEREGYTGTEGIIEIPIKID
jgi:hypothetical protein